MTHGGDEFGKCICKERTGHDWRSAHKEHFVVDDRAAESLFDQSFAAAGCQIVGHGQTGHHYLVKQLIEASPEVTLETLGHIMAKNGSDLGSIL